MIYSVNPATEHFLHVLLGCVPAGTLLTYMVEFVILQQLGYTVRVMSLLFPVQVPLI